MKQGLIWLWRSGGMVRVFRVMVLVTDQGLADRGRAMVGLDMAGGLAVGSFGGWHLRGFLLWHSYGSGDQYILLPEILGAF